ncbi:AfsR/SARP family transcriptional regulator [Saccharopolyspora sp. NPDC047091]|uniref:AfsR/SARP family transcriptional regulator n=1 Tax=Saccharopolyspora sp. NPDC047091 TaxID=3155924 RepID=UPI0033D12304
MEFNLLGRFEMVADDGRSYLLTRSKISQLLGVLLAHNGETVSTGTLIAEIWGEKVPRSALTTLQTYVYHARKMFTSMGIDSNLLITRPCGYTIQAAPDAIDLNRFELHVQQARKALEDARPDRALEFVEQAFRLWRGPMLAGMMTGAVLDAAITYLDELRFSATELHIEAGQRLGRHQELVPQLRMLVAQNPLNESLHAQLIKALHKCGRRAEALQSYRRLWQVLDTELGVEPAPELQRLQHELLDLGAARRGARRGGTPVSPQ